MSEGIQGRQKSRQVPVEAVNLIDHHHVELAILRIPHQPGQIRPEAVFLGGNASIGVDLQ
ncbi:MAG TPA: hypothetical protein PKD23_04265 [Bellilinea sp.]|nr:hypothetical protein [Bellilinea sp.]